MADNVYDEVRYSNYPYAQTHPDRLATVAILHGLEPPDPFHARVLEVGCGAGGNLMAMAAATPGIRAVGVDLAAAPIADGTRRGRRHRPRQRRPAPGRRARADRRRARRVRLHRRPRRLRLDPRRRARRAAGHDRRPRSPGGIAYVSYNAQPGGYFRRMLRDAGLWHARDERRRRRAGREGAGALHVPQGAAGDAGRHLRRAARARGPDARRRPAVPARARRPERALAPASGSPSSPSTPPRHGLGYVGEADLFSLRTEMLPEGVEPEVWRARRRRPDRVRELHRPADRAPLPPERALPRRRAGHARARRPSARSACTGRCARTPSRSRSACWPTRSPRSTACARARSASRSCASALDADPLELGAGLLDGFRRERLIPHAGPLRAATRARRAPLASPLARWQAARGPDLTRSPTRPCAWRSRRRGC